MVISLLLIGAACSDAGGTAEPDNSAPDPTPTVTDSNPSVKAPPPSTRPPPPDIPDVDLSIHSVELADIHFDTFGAGPLTLADSTPETRVALLDLIPPIDQPIYGDLADGAWMLPTDLVIGYSAGGNHYAYPVKILNFHEIVNDEIAGIPILISYCPLCRSAVVYDRRSDGQILSFSNTSALYDSDLVMVDRETGSYWWQVPGQAIVGPLTGRSLTHLPAVTSTWAQWTADHPDTLVMTRDTGFIRTYTEDVFAGYADFLGTGNFPFPTGEEARDARLPPAAVVVAVEDGEQRRVYPVDGLGDGAYPDRVGDFDVVVFIRNSAARVFRPTTGAGDLTFRFERGAWFDDETGSTWTFDGIAIDGELAGQHLQPVATRTTYWFAYVAAFPTADVFIP